MDFYYDEGGKLFDFSYNGIPYYTKNLQSDIIRILDRDGSQVVSYVYDSWGKLISTSGSLAETVGVQNPFRYRGYYYDVETGFYYLQSRYYDPVTGRFINSDSLIGSTGELNTHNMFAYCGNEPINRVDPAGFAWYYPFNQYSDTGLEMGPVYIKTSDLISSPSSVYGNVVGGLDLSLSAGAKSVANSSAKAPRPNNIGKGQWAKQMQNEVAQATKFGQKSAKVLNVVSYGSVAIDVGIGIYENVQNNAAPHKVLTDALVDVAISGGSIWAAGYIGAAIGSVIPGAGTLVGGLIGMGVGLLLNVVTDCIYVDGKNFRQHTKDAFTIG